MDIDLGERLWHSFTPPGYGSMESTLLPGPMPGEITTAPLVLSPVSMCYSAALRLDQHRCLPGALPLAKLRPHLWCSGEAAAMYTFGAQERPLPCTSAPLVLKKAPSLKHPCTLRAIPYSRPAKPSSLPWRFPSGRQISAPRHSNHS